ncbi:hypothetical protein [Desertivirga xinjiangensis]|uniref:hypothetical protein n=1 Tax=Desertivirga xinjiangensis TaxID=539206 RepID=UPI00210A1E0C|nr:hypothetical protein [Pedobacter xinjiangensis]
MANVNENRQTNNANNPSHYTLMTLGIVITMVGVGLRFIGTFSLIDVISNIILIVGVLICLKSVSNILK